MESSYGNVSIAEPGPIPSKSNSHFQSFGGENRSFLETSATAENVEMVNVAKQPARPQTCQENVGTFVIHPANRCVVVSTLLKNVAVVVVEGEGSGRWIRATTITHSFKIEMTGDWQKCLFQALQMIGATEIYVVGERSLNVLRKEFPELENTYPVECDRRNVRSARMKPCAVCGQCPCPVLSMYRAVRWIWTRNELIRH